MTATLIPADKRIQADIAICCAVLLTGLACCNAVHAAPPGFSKGLDIRADAGFMFDSNVTRANTPADKHADRSYSVNLSKPFIRPVSDHTRALLTGFLGAEKFVTYSGLSRAIGGAQGELQYRSSAEFTAPTLAVFARIVGEQYQSKLRDGYRYSLGVSIRQPVTDRIQLFGAVAHNQRYANSAVFDIKDDSARLNLDYALGPKGTLYLGGEYRSGDIVSTGQPTLAFISIAKVFAEDDAYPGGLLYSYRFDGKTVLATLGYNHGFSSRHSLDISWRRIKSTSDWQPSYSTSEASYVANQYSIVYLVNF